MNTIEQNNILICDFLGIQHHAKGARCVIDGALWWDICKVEGIDKAIYNSRRVAFNSDWVWLMAVIKAIKVVLQEFDQKIRDDWREAFDVNLLYADINREYAIVVDFIKWYNEQK